MNVSIKNKIASLLTVFSLIITVFQGLIPAMPISNNYYVTVLSGCVMLLLTIATIWKQYLSNEIATQSIKWSLLAALIGTLGGINEFVGLIQFDELTAQWVRFSFTFILASLNAASKILFPTPQTNSKL